MRRRLNAALRLDPTTWVAGFALWSLITGASILASEDVMLKAPTFQYLSRIPVPENAWGALMLLDAAALLWAASRPHLLRRAVVTSLSGLFWVLWGGGMIVGGLRVGIISGNGIWNVAAGIGLCLAMMQWVTRAWLPSGEGKG
ncbi:hypothetical protein [Roseomonas indoligenes]|uniref:Uncharacterized protein n=1 Tax=Roseomonas indoligenes TaxID=2820811 RepID=A0A940MUV8_9PROT|nr:hypothetical protein [Pararoseomonas indoligenes]MBP0492143.1 hypothetical protein [Pararoseomonas indoligenes]